MSAWDREGAEDLLRALHKEGKSCSEIAKLLNKQFSTSDYTRNSVIGKIVRKGLSRGAAVGKINSNVMRNGPKPAMHIGGNGMVFAEDAIQRPPVVKPPPEKTWRPLPGSEPAPFGTLGVCKWPIDGFAEPMCCGRSKDAASVYCDTHEAVACGSVRTPAQKAADESRRQLARERARAMRRAA